MSKLRILIDPIQDVILFSALRARLDAAIADDPDTWEHEPGEQSIVEHYAYLTPVLSATVLAPESLSTYWRLTIRTGENAVFDDLRDIVARHYGMV